ncbi:hypothetical protein D5S17_09425 [Pseudonocardiaceae bacterium YIM PH 21723]|nr:hypothetical protein D5S17_09425 [Pseudonocardiaceae bacterium YIM PH 21723]
MAKGKSPGGKEQGRVSIRVVPDTSRFRAELKRQLEQATRGLVVKIPVRLDTHAAAAQVRKTVAELDGSLNRISFRGLDLPFDRTELAVGRLVVNLSTAAERVQEIGRRVWDVTKRVANLRGHWQRVGTTLSGIPRHLRTIRDNGLLGNLRRISKGLLLFKDRAVSALSALPRVAGHALGAVRGAFSSLGSGISSAIEGLGSLGRTAWIAIAVLTLLAPALGLISALLAGLPSLGLAAGAAIAAVALGLDGIKAAAKTLTPQFEALKKVLSQTFSEGLAPIFAQLKAVFPILERGLTTVAKGVISWAQAFTDAVTSARGLALVEGILTDTGSLLSGLAPMVRDGITALLELGRAGAAQFGLLSSTLNTFAAGFLAMTQRVIANGSFASAIEGLAKVTGSLLEVFTRLFEVGLAHFGALARPLVTFLDGFTTALVGAMPILTALSNLLLNVLGEALAALGPLFAALAPSITLLGQLLGELLVGAINTLVPILTPLAKIINEVLLIALRAIQPVIKPLVEFFTKLGEIIGTFLTQAFDKLRPLLEQTGQFLGQLLTALTPLLPPLADLAGVFLKALLDILTPLMPVLLRVAQELFPKVAQAVTELVPQLIPLITTTAEIVRILGELAVKILTAVIPVMEAVLQVVLDVWPYVQRIITDALRIIHGAIELAMGLITGDWQRAWSGIKDILGGSWDLIKATVRGGAELVISIFANLPGAILRALGNLGGLLLNAGWSIIRGLINGIQNALGGLWDLVSSIGPGIAARKGPLPYDKRLLVPAGRAIMAGLHRGLATGFVSVAGLVDDMADRITAPFTDPALSAGLTDGIADPVFSGALHSSLSTQWSAQLGDTGLSGIGEQITDALTGWSVQMDANGLARMVNGSNLRRARRG